MTMNKRIGIICAMDIELADLVSNLEDAEVVAQSGYEFHLGRFGSTDVVLVQCGVGLVNAARGTQMMIDKFAPTAIINSGIAGGTGEGLKIGDIVISTSLVQHDFDASPFGYVKGYQCTGLGGDKPTIYTADEELVAALSEVAAVVAAELGEDRVVHTGVIASGDQFIANVDKKTELRELFGATAAEMEGSAIAQAASYSEVPFAVLRVISDLANGDAPENYEAFEKEAANLSAHIMRKCAEAL